MIGRHGESRKAVGGGNKGMTPTTEIGGRGGDQSEQDAVCHGRPLRSLEQIAEIRLQDPKAETGSRTAAVRRRRCRRRRIRGRKGHARS